MRTEYDELELIADFLNTHDKRQRFENDEGVDSLTTPKELHSWLFQHQLISEEEVVTAHELELALNLRSGLRKTISNTIHDEQRKDKTDVEVLNQVAKHFHFRIVFEDGATVLQPDHTAGKWGLGTLLTIILELKRKGGWERVKACSAADCQWVFIDRSKPGTGKWCSMKACGNRAKNKTFRERNKSTHIKSKAHD